MVSKHLHCLNDLLFRASTGALQIEIPAVVSNHPDAGPLVRSYGIDFHHVPVTPETKADAEERLLELVDDTGRRPRRAGPLHAGALRRPVPPAVRARDQHPPLVPARASRAPGPTTRPSTAGVKLVGATAHYVTADLDEGPIIEQDVVRVDHGYDQDQLVAAGRDVEAQVLSRAVRWHAAVPGPAQRRPDRRLPLRIALHRRRPTVLSDIEIANAAVLRPIKDVAGETLGIAGGAPGALRPPQGEGRHRLPRLPGRPAARPSWSWSPRCPRPRRARARRPPPSGSPTRCTAWATARSPACASRPWGPSSA